MKPEEFRPNVCDTGAHCYACRTSQVVRDGFRRDYGLTEIVCPRGYPIGWKPDILPPRVCHYLIDVQPLTGSPDCRRARVTCHPPESREPQTVTGRFCGTLCKHQPRRKNAKRAETTQTDLASKA